MMPEDESSHNPLQSHLRMSYIESLQTTVHGSQTDTLRTEQQQQCPENTYKFPTLF